MSTNLTELGWDESAGGLNVKYRDADVTSTALNTEPISLQMMEYGVMLDDAFSTRRFIPYANIIEITQTV